jgi:hypothetical protein
MNNVSIRQALFRALGGSWGMIRRDIRFVSGLLFTIALVALVPHNLRFAATWHQAFLKETESLFVQNYLMPMGFAALAIVAIGLIVVWKGYVQGIRWTWFVMFIIVWVYAFPVYMLPLLLNRPTNWFLLFQHALQEQGADRSFVKGALDFLLMVVALFLPVKSIFRGQQIAPATGMKPGPED